MGSLKFRQTLHNRLHLILKSCRRDEWEQKERMVTLRVGFQATGRKPTTDWEESCRESRFGQRTRSIPLPTTSWEATGMKGLKESSIIELLLKSLQGLAQSGMQELKSIWGIKCVKIMEVSEESKKASDFERTRKC